MYLSLYRPIHFQYENDLSRKRGNRNPYIKEEQTTQWPKEKAQQDKQLSTKHTYKTKDRVTRTPLKTGDELRCSGRVSSSCSTSVKLALYHRQMLCTGCKCLVGFNN